MAGHGSGVTDCATFGYGYTVQGTRMNGGKTVEAWLGEYLEHNPDYQECLDLVTGL